MKTRIFHLQNLSALHVGTGQGVGMVDLPIARAKATNLPIVAGSAIKGVLRDELQQQKLVEYEDIKTLFGPYSEDIEQVAYAGAIAFGDANLLLLPIRSFAGTVAYATCPYILRQYQRDIGENINIPELTAERAVVANGSKLLIDGKTIALEDLDIEVIIENAENSKAEEWADYICQQLYPDTVADYAAWREQMKQRFVVLPDDIFSFLADTATEIRTRIRVDKTTRVVVDGALWTEENLPAETVLWGVIGVNMSRKRGEEDKTAEKLANLLPTDKEVKLQIGGKHTIGRGLCRLLLNNPETTDTTTTENNT